jgi:diguanylate cyclase (GGDEF)-like protein
MDTGTLALAGTSVAMVAGVTLMVSAELGRKAANEAARLRAALWQEQRFDPMTGLHNRRALVDELKARQAHGGAWSLVRFDADRFKEINDTFGHAIGDLVLVEVAQRLAIGAGEHGFPVRIHGDEFAIVSPFAADAAVLLMERVAELVAQPMRLECGVRLTVRMSVGLVDGGVDAEPEALMDFADQAVYRSKRCHRLVVWQPAAPLAPPRIAMPQRAELVAAHPGVA